MRKRWFIVSFAILLCACGASPAVSETSAAEITEDEAVSRIMEKMTLRQQAGQMLVIAMRTWTDDTGSAPVTELNDELRETLKDVQPGGVILFSENIETAEQTRQLTADIQDTVYEAVGIGALIGADQEGGYITRLIMGTDFSGNMALAATGKPELAQQTASLIGEELAALGMNTDFAPDADINNNPANPVIGIRSFSDDPNITAEYAAAFSEGLKESGIVACAKHFPGHGNTDTDSHTGLPLVECSREEMEAQELVPFRKLAESGVPMIMTAHIQYPQIETQTYSSVADGQEVYLPATLSHTVLTDLLRNEIGYEGVVITDAMMMDAVQAHFDREDAAVLAVSAGADMLLMPVQAGSAEECAELREYVDGIVKATEEGRIPEERIHEACRRILTLKYRYSLIDPQLTGAGFAAHHEAERSIADAGVTVLKNDSVLPLGNEQRRVLLCAPYDVQITAMEYQIGKLKTEGYAAGTETVSYVYDPEGDINELFAAAAETDTVIALSTVMKASELASPETGRTGVIRRLQAWCSENGKKLVVVSCGNPYDCALYTDADALMAVYGLGGMVLSEGEPCEDYGPNIPAAMDVIFGAFSPAGKLPVNIPVIEDGEFGDVSAFERGSGLSW